MAGMTLHIYPMHGSWVPTEFVEILSTLPCETPEQRGQYLLADRGYLPRIKRDDMFDMLGDMTIRQQYADIIVHAEPFAT